MSAVLTPRMSLQDYLDWENARPDKNEFVEGEVYAMTGGRRSHGRVLFNLAQALGVQLKGSACQAFGDSMKVQINANTVLYPDVFVTCDKQDLATDQIFRAPKLVIEILSPSTQAYDRSKKFALYRQLASLQEYILVDPETRRVEAFRRQPGDVWQLHDMSDDAALHAASIDCTVSLLDVFDGVDPPGA